MNALHVARRWNSARRFSLPIAAIVSLSCALLVNACGGGASTMTNPAPSGTAMVTLTDMPGDFSSYMVNIVSLKLTRADGTTVETVPVTTTVDFAQLVNLSEVVSAHQVPEGSYTGVSLTLDYNGAKIVVDNGAGGITVPAASIMNGATNMPLVSPNNQMTVTLQLPSGSPLVITDGTVSHLALDFNLSASNTLNPSTITSMTSAVTVTVNPVLVASLTPDVTKPIRVRGPLVSVTNTSSQTSYTVKVFPFFTDTDDDMGQVVVYTTTTTAFTINGTSYTGNAGLTALAALPMETMGTMGTMTLALGTFDTTTRTFTAAQVFAGTSVPGAGLDSVEGTVVARSGNVLTVRHAFFEPEGGGGVSGGEVMSASAGASAMGSNTMGSSMGGHTMGTNMVVTDFGFFGQVTVTVASTTMVTEDGQSGTFGPQNISVGQHVQAFGKAGTDTSGNPTLDASSGSVRLMVTRAWGQFTSAMGSMVTMNLQALDGLPASAFNFAGTGGMGTDATASAYSVSIPAALTVPTLGAGAPIAFDGFVTPFGSAPPDFAAVTLVNFATANAHLHLEWQAPGPTTPFASLSATNVMMTQMMVQSAAQHVIFIGPVMEDPGSVSAGLSFVPNTAATRMLFAIGHNTDDEFQVYSTFSDFITALSGDLNGTTQLLRIEALGQYDLSTGVLSVNFMAVVLSN